MDFSGHAWPRSGKKKLGEALCFDSVLTDTNNTLPEARDEKKTKKKKTSENSAGVNKPLSSLSIQR